MRTVSPVDESISNCKTHPWRSCKSRRGRRHTMRCLPKQRLCASHSRTQRSKYSCTGTETRHAARQPPALGNEGAALGNEIRSPRVMPESIGDAVALSVFSTHTTKTCTTETCEDAFICEMIFPALRNYPFTRSFPTGTSGWSGSGVHLSFLPSPGRESAPMSTLEPPPPTTLVDGNLALGGGVRSCSARPAWCSQQQRRACDKGQVCLSSRPCLSPEETLV